MQRIIQMQDNTIKKEKRDYRIINQFSVNRFSRFSINRFSPAAVGDTVMVPIPDVDRGRAEFPNVKAVVIEVEILKAYKCAKNIYRRTAMLPINLVPNMGD